MYSRFIEPIRGQVYAFSMPDIPTPDGLDAAWLDVVLRDSGRFPGVRVRSVTAERIGVGFGLDGTSIRAQLVGDGAPATVVVKWTSAVNVRSEQCFYRHAAPRLDLRLPTLIAAQIDETAGRGVLVLSDIAPARQGDTLLGASPAESDALIDAMAEYHALYWEGRHGSDAPAIPVCSAAPRWLRADEEWRQKLVAALPRFRELWADRLPSAAIEFAADLPTRVASARDGLAAAPRTLVHGDLHLDNVLFIEEEVPVILDWPSAYRGPAGVDFWRLLLEGMTIAARHERQERLVARYLQALESRGVQYDRERLLSDGMHVATLLYAAAALWATGPGAAREDVPRVAALCQGLVRRCADAVTRAGPKTGHI